MFRNTKCKLLLLIFAIIITLSCSFVFAAQLPKWFPFKKKDALISWKEKIFKGRTLYNITVNETDGYLTAYSKSTASGLFYRVNFNPRKEPMVSWKWKVVKFPDKNKIKSTDDGWIEKDDYAARFYIIFPKFLFNLTKSLEYVWDKELPEDTIMESPYFKNIKLIVIETGKENLGKWVYEERNIYEDYKKAFKKSPDMVGAIAIMTDTDNTTSTAEAHYDEIKVGYKDETE